MEFWGWVEGAHFLQKGDVEALRHLVLKLLFVVVAVGISSLTSGGNLLQVSVTSGEEFS